MRRPTLTAEREARILQLALQGRGVGEIATQTALGYRHVEAVLTQYGWPDKAALDQAMRSLQGEEDVPAATPTVKAKWELVVVPVAELIPDPDNPRHDLHEIEDLAASIESMGLLQPIVARRRGGRLIVVAGHRRLAAVKLLGRETVEVVVTRDLPPQEVLLAMLVENGQRADVDPIEEAHAFQRLVAEGLSQNAIAERIGRSNAHVSMRLSLLTLSKADQEAVRAGQLPIMQAVERARRQAQGIQHGAGRARANRGWHFGDTHPLATGAATRCAEAGHAKGRRLTGGTACGECWEAEIRLDERKGAAS